MKTETFLRKGLDRQICDLPVGPFRFGAHNAIDGCATPSRERVGTTPAGAAARPGARQPG